MLSPRPSWVTHRLLWNMSWTNSGGSPSPGHIILSSICTIVTPSDIGIILGRSWISTHPSGDGAYRTMFSKKSAKTCCILTWSPCTVNVLISSGISRINCTLFSLSNNITWLTTASITLPRKKSSFSRVSELLADQKVSQIQQGKRMLILHRIEIHTHNPLQQPTEEHNKKEKRNPE